MRWFLRLFRAYREMEADNEALNDSIRYYSERLRIQDHKDQFLNDTIRSLGEDKAKLQDKLIDLERLLDEARREMAAAKDRELETLRTALRPQVDPNAPSPRPVYSRRQVYRRVAELNAETRKQLAQLSEGEVQS